MSDEMLHWSFAKQEFDLEVTGEGSEWALMQYTGLKDKNGKEIYEGDILKHKYGGTQFAAVTFHDCSFYTGGVLLQSNHSSVIEVIGNIYENPELLK